MGFVEEIVYPNPQNASSYNEFLWMMESSEAILKEILIRKWGETNLLNFYLKKTKTERYCFIIEIIWQNLYFCL